MRFTIAKKTSSVKKQRISYLRLDLRYDILVLLKKFCPKGALKKFVKNAG